MKKFKVTLWLQNGSVVGVWTVKEGFEVTSPDSNNGQFLRFRGETGEGKKIQLNGLRHNTITIEEI